MNSRVPFSKNTVFISFNYGGFSRVQLPPAPPKFLVDGYQNHHRSPESPQGESLAGFFVFVISRSHPNQFGNFVAVTVRIKAINGGDTLSVDPKYCDAYSTHIPAVNNNPMRFTDRSGGVSRRRVILHFPEIIPAD